MKVFVTGHQGYIGTHLVDLLKQEGHTVIGCDLDLFEGCNWEPMVKADRELVKDVRKIEAADLDGCDCVMHLAAISNDPMGALNAQLTFDVNRDASIRLARDRQARPASRATCSPAVARSTARARSSTSTRATRSIP